VAAERDALPPTALFAEGVAVHEGFVSGPQVRELRDCAEERRQRGDFHEARIGGAERRQRRADIRGDRICWIEAPLLPPESALLEDLERLRLTLNREAYLGLLDVELHYAWYPPGAGYARHVDQVQGQDHRQVSFVLYLNEGWTPAWGGELRLFEGAASRDIEPRAGRLVCFLTAGREHAVLPTHRDRLSITGWFRRRH
jgi:SM-20-related protein